MHLISTMAPLPVLSLVVCCMLAHSVAAQPRIGEDETIRIASWNLLDAVSVGLIERKEPNKRGWRNTFGSERRIEAKPKFAGEKLGADIVLLQGVKNIREVRQLFPARSWKLIVSRQILRASRDGSLSGSTQIEGIGTTTAIAVRYQRRLRVTGTEHLMELSGSRPAGDASSIGPETPDIGQPASTAAPAPPVRASSAGLAVRISFSGMMFWAVSAALANNCRNARDARCVASKKLDDWLQGKRDQGLNIVIGGQLDPGFRKAGAYGACANQEIVTDKALDAETGADTVAGCVAFADLSAR